MAPTDTTETQSGPAAPRHADRGTTFIELLIAIVLLGTVVIAVLTAVQVAVIGSRVERDHARAQQWLQSAVGALQAAPRAGCNAANSVDGDEPAIRAQYTAALQANVVTPPNWAPTQLEIVPRIRAWDGELYWDPTDPGAPATCFDSAGHYLQLVEIRVRSIDGDIIESVEVVKDE